MSIKYYNFFDKNFMKDRFLFIAGFTILNIKYAGANFN